MEAKCSEAIHLLLNPESGDCFFSIFDNLRENIGHVDLALLQVASAPKQQVMLRVKTLSVQDHRRQYSKRGINIKSTDKTSFASPLTLTGSVPIKMVKGLQKVLATCGSLTHTT